jgi:hypothetical protein
MEIPLIVESLEVADGVDRPRVGASYVKSSLLRSTLAGRDFGKGEFPFRLNFDNSSGITLGAAPTKASFLAGVQCARFDKQNLSLEQAAATIISPRSTDDGHN